MNTCDTCKWWDNFQTKIQAGQCTHEHTTQFEQVYLYRLDGVEYDNYEKVPIQGKGRVQLIDSFFRVTSPTAAYPDTSNDYGADLTTGPKFGCIHHEPK